MSTRHGTVAIHVDVEAGVLRVFAEPDPHPADWAEALLVIRRQSNGAGLLDCYSDGSCPCDLFTFALR